MKNRFLWAMTVAAVTIALAAPSAKAIPTTLTIDSSQSTLQLIVGAIGGSATGAVLTTVSGTVGIDLSIAAGIELLPDVLSITGSDADLSDGSLVVNLGFLGGVSASLFGVGASFVGGPFNPDSTASVGMAFYDPGGTVATLDQGFITYKGTGAVGGLLGSGTFDFATDPTSVAVPSSPGTVKVTVTQGPGPLGVTMFIPLFVTSTITTDPVDVTATLIGQILATGILIPEPTTLALLAMGVLGLVPVIRKKLRKSA